MKTFFEKEPRPKSSFQEPYSINLMWINNTLDETKTFITNDSSETALLERLKDALEWKNENPDADVILWYDSNFVTPNAIEATEAILKGKGIILRNIRNIDLVKDNPDAFSDYIPVYFRIDLLKFIICVNSIETDSNHSAIFADLDVPKIPKEELFNNEVMERLKLLGIQVNWDPLGAYENKFIQIINKPEIINALKVFINANLARAITALNLSKINNDHNSLPGLSTSVFTTMIKQLFLLIIGTITEKIRINIGDQNNPEWVPYEPSVHSHQALGNYYHRYNEIALIINGTNFTNAKQSSHYLNLMDFYEKRDDYQFSRETDARGGNTHYESYKNLIPRAPADGSETYKYKPLEIKAPPSNELKINFK